MQYLLYSSSLVRYLNRRIKCILVISTVLISYDKLHLSDWKDNSQTGEYEYILMTHQSKRGLMHIPDFAPHPYTQPSAVLLPCLRSLSLDSYSQSIWPTLSGNGSKEQKALLDLQCSFPEAPPVNYLSSWSVQYWKLEYAPNCSCNASLWHLVCAHRLTVYCELFEFRI